MIMFSGIYQTTSSPGILKMIEPFTVANFL